MTRVLTGVALIAFALYLIWWAPHTVFVAGAALVGILCYWEFSGLVERQAIRRPGFVGFLAGLALLFRPGLALPEVALLVVLSFILGLRSHNLRDVLPEVACVLLGSVYCFAPWRFAIELRHESVHLLFVALALNWAGDTAAFYVGRLWGKHKLAPVISPGKSWEGSIASTIGALLFSLMYLGNFMPHLAVWKISVLAIAGSVAGQFGDLAESAVKRGAGVKDSGTLLPGHGGALDRLDSSMFALPVVYVLYQLLETGF
jgi:phosphatidate cytidylyltransferase